LKTILVIDDESSFRELLHRALRAKGFLVLEAANCRSAILAATVQVPDLIVCDVEMPDGTGHDVFDALKAKSAGGRNEPHQDRADAHPLQAGDAGQGV
jgi:CheY-like chemotaxis protein